MVASTASALSAATKPLANAPECETFVQDAKKVAAKRESWTGAAVVTEGFLGQIQSAKTVTAESVAEQKRLLAPLYEGFFKSLSEAEYGGTVVMCVPFWEIAGEYVFFTEFFDILKRYGFYSEHLLPQNLTVKATRYGSLLYKRPGQTVGREIARIVRGRETVRKESDREERIERPSKPAIKPNFGKGFRPDFRKPSFGGGRIAGFGNTRSGGAARGR